MRTTELRKFTLFDAMFLIAATAFALVPIRFLQLHLPVINYWSPAVFLRLGMMIDAMLCPVALTLAPVLCALRLQRPRPGLGPVFRQPGMAAATCTLVNELFFVTISMISLIIHHFAGNLPNQHLFYRFNFVYWVWIFPMCITGITVSAVWVVLWMSGAWRGEQSWIDRAGRILGIYWVANSLLFGSAMLAGML
jgi:hypothetical protein